jgi:hypothetical protein
MVLRPLTAVQTACQDPPAFNRDCAAATLRRPLDARTLPSEEHAGKAYRRAAILANARPASSTAAVPDPPLNRCRDHGACRVGIRVAGSGPRLPHAPWTFRRTSRSRRSRNLPLSRTSAHRCRNPTVLIRDRLRSGQDDDGAGTLRAPSTTSRPRTALQHVGRSHDSEDEAKALAALGDLRVGVRLAGVLDDQRVVGRAARAKRFAMCIDRGS